MAGKSVLAGVGGIDANLSPDAFHMLALHNYKCRQDFMCPDRFSLLPYFLLSRAIELGIKSIHLRDKGQLAVKRKYWHELLEAYKALDKDYRILDQHEIEVLKTASELYKKKRFEYPNMCDCLTAYSDFPDLAALDELAEKVISLWDWRP